MTRNSDNQAGGYPEGMDQEACPHEAWTVGSAGQATHCVDCGAPMPDQPVSGEPETGGVETDQALLYRASSVQSRLMVEGEREAGKIIADLCNALACRLSAPVDQSGEAVAWRGQTDGIDECTVRTETRDDWIRYGRKITPLYAAPVPTGGVSAILNRVRRKLTHGHDHEATRIVDAIDEIDRALKGASNA